MSRAPLAALLGLWLLAAPARALEAAAAKVDITADLKAEKVWLAGFGAKGRRPTGVHDPLYARIVLLREGKRTVALVGFDLLGFPLNDTRRLRAWEAGGPGRSLFTHATHTHSGPDTLGLWGPMIGISGVDPRYMARVDAAVRGELEKLEGRLAPARARGASGRLDPRGLCRDLRDPQVIDPSLGMLRIEGVDGRAIAAIVNWSCHPEVIGKGNSLLSADYVGPLCARIEEKTGGECLFLSGAIGGLMSPEAEETFAESERVGRAVADAALALKTGAASAGLTYRALVRRVPVENSRYLLFLPALARGHELYAPDGALLPAWRAWALALEHLVLGLAPEKRPLVETEVSLLDVGPARVLGVPGELFPELAIGGYDGRYSFGRAVVSPGGPERDLKSAPKGPYLRDLIRASVPMLAGLANDEIGYIVPEYDFKVRPSKTMLPRYPGHYEETNSIGPSATAVVIGAAEALLKEPRP